MHYYNFNIGDYLKHTLHLTLEEDLAYRRLLDMYYDTEAPIPNNIPLVSRRLRMGSEVVESVLNEFFEASEEGYRNYRADGEIADYHKFLEKQKANGRLGGRPKKGKKPIANPDLTQSEPKITLNNKQQTTNNIYTDEFESFWKVYDKPSGKANAFKVWKSIKPDSNLIETILAKATLQAKNVERKFRKDAERWLRDKRWEDEISDVQQVEKVKFI